MGSAMRISNASTDPKEKWDLPQPNLRPGADDFLKLKSRNGQELRPYRPPMATIHGEREKGGNEAKKP